MPNEEHIDFPPMEHYIIWPVHLPGGNTPEGRLGLCGKEVQGSQIGSQSNFFQVAVAHPELACNDCLEIVRARGVPTTCRRCYRQRVKMFRRDDRILCSGCLLDVLEHEGLIERIEVRSGR